MPSITSWTRLEPQTTSPDLAIGLQAQLHDPLWCLTRQWQFGEFQGEDAGSPVIAHLQAESAQVSRYYPGPIADPSRTAEDYNSAEIPLETLVERDRPAANQLKFAAEAGLHFLRLLDQHQVGQYRVAYRQSYPLQTPDGAAALDPESRRFVQLMVQRVPDGRQLYALLKSGLQPDNPVQSRLPSQPEIAPADRLAVINAGLAWLTWYESLYSQPADQQPWISSRMEYEFAVGAATSQGEVVLVAPEYQEGHLDWPAFSIRPQATLGATVPATPIEQVMIPTPVRYRGMPNPRWWEFEDAQVDFNAIETEPEDLSRLLLVEFGLIYGNDWFVIPLDLPVGSLCQIHQLEVTDTFGDRTVIEPCRSLSDGNGSWDMFHLSWDHRVETSQSAPNLFFLPPTLSTQLQSAPVEEVLFLRDEMANLVWAVEQKVENPLGQPRDRLESELTQPLTPAPASATNGLTYQLASQVPDHWIPLIPQAIGPGSIRLKLASLITDHPERRHQPTAHILRSSPDLELYEEEVPRAGAKVTRAYQYSRWLNGSAHLWIGQRKQPGRGEGNSNLQFDRAIHQTRA